MPSIIIDPQHSVYTHAIANIEANIELYMRGPINLVAGIKGLSTASVDVDVLCGGGGGARCGGGGPGRRRGGVVI